MVSHLNDRLVSRDLGILSAVSKLLPPKLQELDGEEQSEISANLVEQYSTDLPFANGLLAEIKTWKSHCQLNGISSLALKDAVKETQSSIFQNLHTLFILLLTLPVTTASAERPFSYLCILKNNMRSTMN